MAIPESIQTLRLSDIPSLGRLQQRALVIGAVALLAGLAGAFTNVEQFFRSYLIGVLFCLSLALGSLALLMVQHLSGGQWGLVSRRIFEASTRTLPIVAILFVPVMFGLPEIFLWARPDVVAADHVLQMKAAYLNVVFFVIRAAIYFAFWILCMWLLNKWSAGQDRGEGTTKLDSVRFRKVSAPGLLFLVITVTFASVDWVMSIDPHWFSTIFGLLTIAGYGLTALAFTIAVLAVVDRDHTATAFLTPRHFHDLGKLLLAFVMLWAYLSFSQFLIIWSGNLPEEIPWYIQRVRGPWGAVAIALVIGHFALPFCILLSATLKKRSALLAKVAIFVVCMRLVDLIWLIAPTFRHAVPGEAGTVQLPVIPVHWMDVALPVGLLGLWIFLFVRQLGAQLLFPVNDPYFKDVFAHEAH
jgi:hypothetical protein